MASTRRGWRRGMAAALLAASGWAAGCGADGAGGGDLDEGSPTQAVNREQRCDAVCNKSIEFGCEFDIENCKFNCMESYRQAEISSGVCVVLLTASLECSIEHQTQCVTPDACL